MKYVKFVGKFRDLIPIGFRFWKAFARNYRVYEKRVDGKRYGPVVNIWQHLGGYLEIDDYFHLSVLIVESIQSGQYKEFLATDPLCKGTYHAFINLKDFTIERRDRLKHNEPYFADGWDTLSEIEKAAKWKDYNNTWRRAFFCQGVVDIIKDLFDRGWIQIVENKDKVYNES